MNFLWNDRSQRWRDGSLENPRELSAVGRHSTLRGRQHRSTARDPKGNQGERAITARTGSTAQERSQSVIDAMARMECGRSDAPA